SKGDLEKVLACIDQGADVNWTEKKSGRTALTSAVIEGQLDIARLLVERKADLNWRDTAMGFTPLGWACECNHPALVDYLLQAGADPNLATPEYKVTPLMAASKHGDFAIVGQLLKAGANPHAATCDGRTALQFAQANQQTKVTQLLESIGVTANSPLPKPTQIHWPAVDETGATCDHSSPEKVLRGFIFAMNQFEKNATRLDKPTSRTPAVTQAILHSQQTVFDLFCTPAKRPYGRNGSYRIPPEYNPDGESLISVTHPKPSRTELITRDEQAKEEFLYVLLKKKDRWLLDSKQRRTLGANWMKWFL
ncbi:MAG: ankyrin repeat domain-containing protein, partial [Verrucomicrobiota bacterium]